MEAGQACRLSVQAKRAVGAPYEACRLSTEAKTPSRAIWGAGQPPSRAV